MDKVINSHVTRLTQYLTFEPGHDQIYEERADTSHLSSIDTRAKQRLLELMEDQNARLVVLTGDAGHGKTHLCRVALERLLGLDARDAQKRLNELGSGAKPLGFVAGRDLYVVRDMSELREEAVELLLEAAAEKPNRITVVCANEGKLRDVISRASGALDALAEVLEASQQTGRTSIRSGIHVLDLNHQSVTSGDRGGFLAELLQQWVLDGRRWRTCSSCPANADCPILRNRRLLAGEDDADQGARRREGLHLLLRVCEQTGTTITIREALILTAFLVTAGLDCERVQKASAKEKELDWPVSRAYFQVIFAPPLSRDQRATLPLLDALARFDPGRVSIRTVDEALIAVAATQRLAETEVPSAAGKPRTRKQAQSEAKRYRERIAFLRRRDYFDLQGDDEWQRMLGADTQVVARPERLGFRFFQDFENVLLGRLQGKTKEEIVDRVIRGLEAVQDIRRGVRQPTSFLIVDPAYGSVSGSASIVANRISVKRISLLSRRAYWNDEWPGTCDLPSSLDWLDRRAVVLFEPKDNVRVPLELNLLQFEFVMRSAHGLSCRRFYQGDIRRISARLNRLAEERSEEDEILVIHRDQLLKILVDESGKILCEGRA